VELFKGNFTAVHLLLTKISEKALLSICIELEQTDRQTDRQAGMPNNSSLNGPHGESCITVGPVATTVGTLAGSKVYRE